MSDSAGPTPPAGQPRTIVRRAEASPFLQKKRRVPRAPPTGAARTSAPANGTPHPLSNGIKALNIQRQQQIPQQLQQQQQQQQAPQNYQEFPIVISKADLGRGMRFHAIKFKTKLGNDGKVEYVNPYSEEEFTRPLHLHRRYAQDKQQSATAAEHGEQDGVDDKEREILSARRAERQAEREANQALIAPSGTSKRPAVKRKKNQKNIEDVYYNDNDPKQQKAAQLRYEETKPWHLEDFDGKNVWVGQYQEPLSEQSVLFQIIAGAFTMVPVERWYLMRRTDRVVQLTSEEVEKQMSKKYAPGRWFLNTQAENDVARKQQAERRRPQMDDEDDVKQNRAAADSYRADLDELDFEANDEFQDDDEGLIFGEDDETAKATEKKVREEMREANLPATNMKDDEADVDEEEDAENEDRRAQRKLQKKLRKRIVKHEKKYEYDSDSDHPYSDSSEDEDSEEEQQRLEEEQKKKDEAAAAAKAAQSNGGRSGASTAGNNTPAGRTEKRDQSRLSSAGHSLKRPGSPSLSEVSGSESRKKVKINNGRTFSSNNLASADGARSPLSRSMAGYGSGSDTDASRADRPRHGKTNTTGSPHEGSRPGSRAQSPGARGETPTFRAITAAEIRAAIPPQGITVKDLGLLFKARVPKDQSKAFVDLIKANTRSDSKTKMLMPLEQAAVLAE